MKEKAFKTIGVLGGMGAAASADFYARLVKIAQKEYGAKEDSDFPPLMLYNLPLSDFDETGFVDEHSVLEQLKTGLKKLDKSGVDFIVIPCNTVHKFIKEMREAVSVPIISIIESTVDALERDQRKVAGVTSSQSTRAAALYEEELSKRGIGIISATPEEQNILNSIIGSVIEGIQGDVEKNQMKKIIARIAADGADSVVLGCTELPLAITANDSTLPVYSSTDILARAALRESLDN